MIVVECDKSKKKTQSPQLTSPYILAPVGLWTNEGVKQNDQNYSHKFRSQEIKNNKKSKKERKKKII